MGRNRLPKNCVKFEVRVCWEVARLLSFDSQKLVLSIAGRSTNEQARHQGIPEQDLQSAGEGRQNRSTDGRDHVE